jgi:hypothetical protein
MASSASETASDLVEEIPMTQKFRWLTALALLLAFGAGAVRAEEEEQEVSPPAGTSIEVSPPPCPACQSCPSLRTGGQCVQPDLTQYTVKTKFVRVSAQGDCNETSSEVSLYEGQGAKYLVRGIQTPTASHDVSMQFHVTKQNENLRLVLGVEDHMSCAVGPLGQCAWIEGMRKECDVTLGAKKRFVLKKNRDGSDRAWVEIIVYGVAPAEHIQQAAMSEDDADGSALDCVGDVVEDLIDTVADVATSLFGDDAKVEPEVIQIPVASAPREFQVPVTALCPAVKQCVAVEPVKKATRRIYIATAHGRKCVEISDGDKGWKGTADKITLRGGDLVLEGHVHVVTSDGSDEITSEKLSLKAADLEIQIGD